MAKAYTPGLKVLERTLHRARRVLPIPGDVLVAAGDRVRATDVVARTYTAGEITPVNLANLLAVPAGEVPAALLRQIGDEVEAGETIARSKGIFGMFRKEAKAPARGTIESVSGSTGQLILRGPQQPVEVLAYLAGTVVEIVPNEGAVIESDAALVQGIFGIGGEAFGEVRVACKRPDEPLDANHITPDMRGGVVIGGARMTAAAIQRAKEIGAAAVVSGGIDDADLRDFLGYDLGVAITGSERLGLTFIITEGFGDISMAERTHRLLASREGQPASVSGATQIRAGVLRPEIAIPTKNAGGGSARPEPPSVGELEIGTIVRMIRDPHFGLIGSVARLPSEPQVLGSGSKARVLEVRLDSGESVVVPRANVELIES